MSTPLEGIMAESLGNLKQMIDVNTIVGDAITTNDGATIIPVSKVSLGFGAGGSEFGATPEKELKEQKMFGGGCGGGVSLNPVAFLVVKNDNIRLLPVFDSMSTVDRIVDLVPDILNKFNDFVDKIKNKKEDDEEA